MDARRELVIHFLAALAYRTQKALRAAPETFANYRAHKGVRTPHEIVNHMTNVIAYACTIYIGGEWRPEKLPSFDEEVSRFHEMLETLRDHIKSKKPLRPISVEQLLQGPLSDAMTHAGQLALLRRLHGNPVPPENFIYADIKANNLSSRQPDPASPDEAWNEPED